MKRKHSYQDNWDQYYQDLQHKAETPLWDQDQIQSIKNDFDLFKDQFNSDLPVVDFGCDTGNHSLFYLKDMTRFMGSM